MKRKLVALGVSLLMLCAQPLAAQSPAPSSSSSQQMRLADPAVWGVYAHLVGGEWKGSFGRSRSVSWGEGEQMLLIGKALAAHHVSVIVPDGPGRLKRLYQDRSEAEFLGQIGSDGSVVWTVPSGRVSHRHSLHGNALRSESVEVRDGIVVRAWEKEEFKGQPAAVTTASKPGTAPLVQARIALPWPTQEDPAERIQVTGDSGHFDNRPSSPDHAGWSTFPAIPDVPELEPLAHFKALYDELTAESWNPAVRASGPGAVKDTDGQALERIVGAPFCADQHGPVEVRYVPPKDNQLHLTVFRGKEADCDGRQNATTPGLYRFSDGTTLIGAVHLRRNNLRVRAAGHIVFWNGNDICTGFVNADRSIHPQTCWNAAINVVRTAFGHPLSSAHPVRGRLIYPGLGQIDGHFVRGEFKPVEDASFIALDDSIRAKAQLVSSKEMPPGAVLRPDETANASAEEARFFLRELVRFETNVWTSLGGPGAYLFYGAIEPGVLPRIARPEPATLLKYSAHADECSLKPQIPAGWLAWGPHCKTAPDRIDAWSADGRFRIRYTLDADTILQEFDPNRPGLVLSEWRAAAFSTERIPSVFGEGDLRRNEQIVYRGTFDGLAPDGEGYCAIEHSAELEPCTYVAGQRVDAVYLARVEQKKLEAQRESALAQARAEAEEHKRKAAASLAAQRRAEAERRANNGFQWAKFAAITLGAVAGGAGELDSGLQADLLMGAIKDSVAGNDGLSNMDAALSNATVSSPPATTHDQPLRQPQKAVPSAPTAAHTDSPERQCTNWPIKFNEIAGRVPSRDEAESRARRRADIACAGPNGGVATIDIQCTVHQREYVNIDSKGRTTKDPVQPQPDWVCAAQGQCSATRRVCDSGAPGGSRQ